MTVPAHKQAEAARVASEALANVVRLQNIREEHRSLTDPQSSDYNQSVDIWNGAAVVLPELPKFTADRDLSDAEISRASRALNVLRPMYEMRSRMESDPTMRSIAGVLNDPKSGRAPGAPATDEIREMIESGERQHDFRYPTSDETRAINNFSDGTSLSTADFASTVAIYARTFSPWLSVANIVRSKNGRDLVYPELTADSTTYTPGEGTAITESTPTLDHATITTIAYKDLAYISQEALEDSEVNLSELVAASAARSIALKFGQAFTATVLAGINNGGTATGLGGAGTATFFGYEDGIDLKYGRQSPYRQYGAWVMSNGAIKKARKFRDTVGQYLWQPAVAQGQPDGFDGQPVYEDPYLVAPGSATKSVLYGDWKSALVIKSTDIRVAMSDQYRFNTDQIAFKTVWRLGGAVVDATAAAYLVSANS